MKNVAASVLARLKNISKERQIDYNEILLRYAIERVLKRVELSPHVRNCILKGGTLFLVWNNGYSCRPTMDADLEYRGDGAPEELLKVFMDIAMVEPPEDDGLVIDSASLSARQIREDDQYGGVRVTFKASIGNAVIPVQFDIGVGDMTLKDVVVKVRSFLMPLIGEE